MSFPCLNNKKKEDRMEKEEKDIRFVARFYRENRLDTTQACTLQIYTPHFYVI